MVRLEQREIEQLGVDARKVHELNFNESQLTHSQILKVLIAFNAAALSASVAFVNSVEMVDKIIRLWVLASIWPFTLALIFAGLSYRYQVMFREYNTRITASRVESLESALFHIKSGDEPSAIQTLKGFASNSNLNEKVEKTWKQMTKSTKFREYALYLTLVGLLINALGSTIEALISFLM